MISALAVVCVRNEAVHIRRCLEHLIGSGLDVQLIDNGSSDGTREIASEFLGCGLIGIEDLPWSPDFSLSEQLQAKQRVYARSTHDWFVHADADEWLRSPNKGQSLLEGLNMADAAGFTLVNFHEIVFIPLPGEDFYCEDYASRMSTYYFYQPFYPRLHRAWSRRAALNSLESGGHLLMGTGVRCYPVDFILQHYIILSEKHGEAKYVGRRFSDEDLRKGWHNNRVSITREDLKIKTVPELKHIADPLNPDFDLSQPVKKHFWQW